MSFHEKNAWACLFVLLAVYVPYFVFVFQHPMAFVGLFIIAATLLCLLLTGFHAINAVFSPAIRKSGDTPGLDERDIGIERWSAKISGIVLGVLVIVWCLNAMIGIPVAAVDNVASIESATGLASAADFSISALQALRAVHILFAGFVFANLVYYAALIVGYRRTS